MLNKIKCFFGYHAWLWELRQDYSDSTAYCASCKHCGKDFDFYCDQP